MHHKNIMISYLLITPVAAVGLSGCATPDFLGSSNVFLSREVEPTRAVSSRTAYGPQVGTSAGGYSERSLGGNQYVVSFAGNEFTHTDDAALYTSLRAVEICQEKGFKFPRFLARRDLSTSQTVQRTATSSYQQPTFFSGMANSNANLNSFGSGQALVNQNTNLFGSVSGGNFYGDSKSWEETLRFPSFEAEFMCTNQLLALGVHLKGISAEDMKGLVKDFMGAMLVERLADDSPNKGILEAGDVIIRINGERIQSLADIARNLDFPKNRDRIPIVLIRDGKRLSLNARAADGTSILQAETDGILSAACVVPEVGERKVCTGRSPASN